MPFGTTIAMTASPISRSVSVSDPIDFDHARGIHADDVGRLRTRDVAHADPAHRVCGAHRRCAHADDHLAGTRHGIGKLHDFEDVGTTGLCVCDRLHVSHNTPSGPLFPPSVIRTRHVTASLPRTGRSLIRGTCHTHLLAPRPSQMQPLAQLMTDLRTTG